VAPQIRELAAALPDPEKLLGRVEAPAEQAKDLTDRFHVPRGTAVRAASALLASLQSKKG
jgi:hypothetical protein